MADDRSAVVGAGADDSAVDLPLLETLIPSSNPSLLETLGADVIKIVTPVSLCMLLVVLLVSSLPSNPLQSAAAGFISGDPSGQSGDGTWDEIKAALLTSLSFVVLVTLMTFLLVLLFYFRCVKFLKIYTGISSFFVLLFLGGFVSILLIDQFKIPIDPLTFLLLLVNLSVCGVLAVFLPKFPIFLNQGFLVAIGVLTAYWFTFLPEWTTWALLVAMSLYDLAAVLLPIGPLRLLVELAIDRNEDIPALVYESRPVNPLPDTGTRVWRRRRRTDLGTNSTDLVGTEPVQDINPPLIGTEPVPVREIRLNMVSDQITAPLISTEPVQETRLNMVSDQITVPLITTEPVRETRSNTESHESRVLESDQDLIGLSSSGAIKLGLGDFIFYSLLVGRAAMYDFTTVYACYLAIIAGLGVTLVILAFYQKALPALPVSVGLGVGVYGLTRVLLEGFVVECAVNLVGF